MADKKHPEAHQPAHVEFDTSHAEGRLNWIFFEFWPIMIFVVVFLLMNAVPLTLSGLLHNPFSSSDVVWSGYGLLLIAEFVVALIIFIVAPRAIMPYMMLVSAYGLIAAEQGKAWKVGFVSDGQHEWMINNGSILFLAYVAVAWFLVWRDDVGAKKERL
ncbi:MAG TPA: hypothetical protein V6C52_04895 [Coleofasciculaceae cyanobacterium]|jgi:hypothetical protein